MSVANKIEYEKFLKTLNYYGLVDEQESFLYFGEHPTKGRIYFELFPDFSFRIFTIDRTP